MSQWKLLKENDLNFLPKCIFLTMSNHDTLPPSSCFCKLPTEIMATILVTRARTSKNLMTKTFKLHSKLLSKCRKCYFGRPSFQSFVGDRGGNALGKSSIFELQGLESLHGLWRSMWRSSWLGLIQYFHPNSQDSHDLLLIVIN